VLEIGTGYGYQAALLVRLAAQVVSIEIWPDIAAHGGATSRLGLYRGTGLSGCAAGPAIQVNSGNPQSGGRVSHYPDGRSAG
jgi:hypothetical protein